MLVKTKPKTWVLINETDGIEADPRKFKSEEAALKARELLIKRFEMFKEYKTADGRCILPSEVKLVAKPYC